MYTLLFHKPCHGTNTPLFAYTVCTHTHTHTHSVDNSEWMRNGDFIPTRLQSQQDAVNVVTRMKTRQNVENSVGLLSLAE